MNSVPGLLSRHVPTGIAFFLVGIALGEFVAAPLSTALLLVGTSCALFLVALGRPRLLLFAFVPLLLGAGILRAGTPSPVTFSGLDAHMGTRISYVGTVIRDPDQRGDHTNLVVGEIIHRDKDTRVELFPDARILLFAPRYPEFAYGDRIVFAGALDHPRPFSSDDSSGRTFNYPAYLAKDGIGYVMFRPEIAVNEEGNVGNPILRVLYSFKHTALDGLTRALPEPAAGLAAGLIFGEKRAVGVDIEEDFRTAGIAHIVVLSGYNMTVVADGIAAFLGALHASFGMRIAGGAIGVIFFALMTGGGATVFRAAIMALLALLARATGRTQDFGRTLFFAAGAMVAIHPSILLHDPSFQLSFLAALGLVYVSPPIERRLHVITRYPSLRELIVGTLATQIAVLPLLLYMTGQLSLLSLPANLLVLPFVPPAMFLGIAASLLGVVLPSLSVFIAFPATLPLFWILGVAHKLAALPLASVSIPPFSVLVLALLYALLGAMLWWVRPRLPDPLSPVDQGFPGNSDIDKKDTPPFLRQ